jgi:hypothetical protein
MMVLTSAYPSSSWKGIEAMHVMRKGQVKRLDGRDAMGQAKFAAGLFGDAA